jgi:hypothetical protein
MDHAHHRHHHAQAQPSLNRTAWSATLHCLTGRAIGEVLGMVIGTALAKRLFWLGKCLAGRRERNSAPYLRPRTDRSPRALILR